jgi:hypothetical protein
MNYLKDSKKTKIEWKAKTKIKIRTTQLIEICSYVFVKVIAQTK